MSPLREDVVAQAVDQLRAALGGSPAVVLCGSAVGPYGDAFSRPDFLVLDPGAAEAGAPRPARAGGVRYRYFVRPLDAFATDVAAHEDDALYLLRNGRIVCDAEGRARALWEQARAVGPAVWRAKSETGYREYRRRRASLAWTLRRGQMLAALDNVNQLLEHALAICCYVGGEPPPGRKWLFQAALRTSLGSRARPAVLEFLAALGDLSVLGGSYAPRQNRLYVAAGRLQAVIEEEVTHGWPS